MLNNCLIFTWITSSRRYKLAFVWFSFFRITKSLIKLHKVADEALMDGDEEKAYVMLLRYFNLLAALQKLPDFPKNKKYLSDLLGGSASQNATMDKLELIANSLRARYNEKNKNKLIQAIHMEQNELENLEGVAEEDFNAPQEDIDSSKVYAMLKDAKTSMLLLDCRPRKDFQESRIKYSYILNVPEDLLYKGISVSMIQEQFSDKDKTFWASRITKTNIVMLDWNSAEFKPETPIWVLRDILKNVRIFFKFQ